MIEDFERPPAIWWYDPSWDWHPEDRSPRQRRRKWNYEDIDEPPMHDRNPGNPIG